MKFEFDLDNGFTVWQESLSQMITYISFIRLYLLMMYALLSVKFQNDCTLK